MVPSVSIIKYDGGRMIMNGTNALIKIILFMSLYRVMLVLAMQVRVMAACMESQSCNRSALSSSRDRTAGINQSSDVCVWPPSLIPRCE